MKDLFFKYDMHIEYSVLVSKCNYTIKCIPKSNKRQKVSDIKISLFPQTSYCEGVDGLGNIQIYGANNTPHNIFDFHIEGRVTTGLSEYEEEEDENLSMIFGYPHGLNVSKERIKEYYNKINIPVYYSKYDKALYIMDCLHEDFNYKTLVTDVKTTAEEAFVLGEGVCQDYSHIFIALLHLAKIEARYVTGLLLGEGQSHAWVEILCNKKWYGLDPTNNCRVSDNHIKIGVGRDAADCTINRGIMHGGGLHTQTVKVVVTQKEDWK